MVVAIALYTVVAIAHPLYITIVHLLISLYQTPSSPPPPQALDTFRQFHSHPSYYSHSNHVMLVCVKRVALMGGTH